MNEKSLLRQMEELLEDMKIQKETLKDTYLKNVIFKFKYQKTITSLERTISQIKELLDMEDKGFHR